MAYIVQCLVLVLSVKWKASGQRLNITAHCVSAGLQFQPEPHEELRCINRPSDPLLFDIFQTQSKISNIKKLYEGHRILTEEICIC